MPGLKRMGYNFLWGVRRNGLNYFGGLSKKHYLCGSK